jgi:D-glycero-D-manno-heptose 1,7-bisphosphate phosphatase
MDGVYSRIRRPVRPGTALRAAVFLDRDGVITEDTHYLHRAEDVRFIPGAPEAVADINQLGFPVVLVTNQAGIGRGYYGWLEFEAVQECVERGLASCGGWVDAVWACSYHPNGATDGPASYYRKPSPGMLEEATTKLALDLGNSWLAGDKPCDIAAAINAGVRRAVHVLTGYGRETRDEVHRLATENRASCEVHFCDAISDMVPLLKANGDPQL